MQELQNQLPSVVKEGTIKNNYKSFVTKPMVA